MLVTRFAPSPSGRLHLGHAYSAVLGHTRARQAGGSFQLRIEDLDASRCSTEFVEGILEDLSWLGLEWSEPVLVQSTRTARYQTALEQLRQKGLVYACFCSRADIARSLSAPHGDAPTFYPGTCRSLVDDPERRLRTPHSWRLDSSKALRTAGLPEWSEAGRGRLIAGERHISDVILARKDTPASYHLACVIDDAESGVNLVLRGADLEPSTPVQRLLQMILALPEPDYCHHLLVFNADGSRLAKRHGAPTLAAMREQGFQGRRLADLLRMDHLPAGFRFGTP